MYRNILTLSNCIKRGEKISVLYTNVHLTYVDGDKMGFPSLKEFDEDVAKIIKEKVLCFWRKKMAISSFVIILLVGIF